jgi:PAS domain S-box-containing protein
MPMSDAALSLDDAPVDELTQGLAELLDAFGEGFVFFDQDWRARLMNRAAEALGADRAGTVGRVLWEAVPGLLGTPQEAVMRKAMAERLSVQMEAAPVLVPAATFAVRMFPVGVGLGYSFRDVTEYNAMRARERQQAERLDLLLAASGLGDWEWDLVTGLVTYSERAAAIYGVPPGSVTIEESRRLHHPDDTERLRAAARIAIERRAPFEAEFRIQSPVHGEIWCMLRAHGEYDEAGRPVRMLGVVGDITSIKAQERRTRESEARFRAFADSAPAPLWVTRPDGAIEFVNQAAVDFSGRPRALNLRGDRRGFLAGSRVHPDDLAEMERAHAESRANHLPYELEIRLANARGEWRWRRVIVRPRHDHEGGFVGFIGMSVDITDSREAEARQRLLVNELNHRVKNTLATVQSIAQQTLRQGVDPALARHTFVDRLLALSAAHNVLTREKWEGADLREIVAVALRPFEPPEGSHIQVEGPDARLAPQVAVALSMALHELATNAAKYGALSETGGQVSLILRLTSDRAIELEWRERGGPPVQAPGRAGFGTRLLTQGLVGELGRPAELTYALEGLICTLRAPTVGV